MHDCVFKSLSTSLYKREERSQYASRLVPHFAKGGLGGILKTMSIRKPDN